MSHQDERRRLPRRRTRLSAAVIHEPGEVVVACTVRDKSATGARLLIQAGLSLPDAFHLMELNTGDLHKAQVVWRDQSFIGVIFSETSNLKEPKTPQDVRFAAVRARLTSKSGAR